MHLDRLEIQGFKTFAKRTVLSFPAPRAGRCPVTTIVGPNGSGKSNVADAIRWVLGEQSLKLLRGKRSEDIIFSGSEGKARSGFAEVIIILNNEDKAMPIDYAEVAITRRLYRDGESEYLLNDKKVRLGDIQLLLAQANVGQRSYSVVGQGMVDHILVSTPEERKAFFDDATGVRHLQLKRHEAMLKLKRTYENLTEVEMLLSEIEPRLRSLKRQVSRLEQREEVEKSLREMESGYYGTLWWDLQDRLMELRGKDSGVDGKITAATKALTALEARTAAFESEDDGGADDGLMALQKKQRELQKERGRVRDEQFETQKRIELDRVRAQSNWAPLPLNKIIDELETLAKDLAELEGLEELGEIKKRINGLFKRSEGLTKRLQRPAPEDIKPDPALVKKLDGYEASRARIEAELKDVEGEIDRYAAKEKKVRTELIDLQRELRAKQSELHALENERNASAIELARFEERAKNLEREVVEQTRDHAAGILAQRPERKADTDAVYPEIQRLRYKLELIGGIDPEIMREYEETKTRFEFLDGQVTDLKDGIKATEKIVDALDEEIRKQSETAFRKINHEFQRFFKILFEGGSCSLVKMSKDEVEEETGVSPDRVSEDTVAAERERHEEDTAAEGFRKRIKEREDRVVGIDIQATPPGKKLKALNLLSGGERALTSIALISAIMAVNPGPFVLLDEVDAALDEANTFRFANILEELAKLTQFIVITHNRATMERSDLLYGVTMNDDGISNLLSVSLEDIGEGATARR